MQSPFPGMDPYLEAPDLWPDVHSSLMNIFREQLAPLLAPKYVAELETQVVIGRVDDEHDPYSVRPDVTVAKVAETAVAASYAVAVEPTPVRVRVPMDAPTRLISVYLRQRESGKLVTVIELLSPVNKRRGKARQEYLDKRQTFLSTAIHLVEIDLLRAYPRMPFDSPLPPADYLAMVCRAGERPHCDVWPIGVRQSLPTLGIPLRKPDPPVPLAMGQALATASQRARYDLRIDYTQPPVPPLSSVDAEWAEALLRAHASKSG